MEKKYGEIWTNPGTNFGEIWAIICPRILLCRQVCWTTNHDLFSGYKLPRKHCARHPGSWSGIIPAMNIISYHRISHRTDVSWCFYHFQVSQHSFGISCRHLGDRIPTSTNWPGPQRPRPSKHLRTLAFLGARSGKQTHEKWRNMLENRWCFSSAESKNQMVIGPETVVKWLLSIWPWTIEIKAHSAANEFLYTCVFVFYVV